MKKPLLLAGLILLPFLGWAVDAQAPANPSENDFFGEGTNTVSDAKPTTEDQTKQFTESTQGAHWGGTVQSDATWNPGWVGDYPGNSGATWNDALSYDLLTTAYLDSRPDKNFRFHFSLQAGYPFTTTTHALTSAYYLPSNNTVDTTSASVVVPNIKIWELFSDVTIDDWLYLRFGKQSASWGVAYFYSVADVISLSAINVTNPTLQREGPIALKASVPFPGLKANLNGFVLARDSYFTDETAGLENLGYALQGDVLLGQAQLSLGGFYQKNSTPKLVATLNTGLGALNLPVDGTIDVFTEAIFSQGSDNLQGTGSTTVSYQGTNYTMYQSVAPWTKTLYYTGTAGFSYGNSDYNFSLRSEYLYNPFGSADKFAASVQYGTYFASQMNQFQPNTPTNSSGQSFGTNQILYTGIHNMTTLFDMTKVANSKLEFSTFVQSNLSDGSGWVKPYFTIYPWTQYQLGLSWGLQFVYGENGTQYPMEFQSYNSKGQSLGTKRVGFVLEAFFGSTSF